MNASFLLLSAFVFCSLFLGITHGEMRDETQAHVKDEHNRLHHKSRHIHHKTQESVKGHVGVHHHSRHHNGLKTRNSNASTCINVFEVEIIAIIKWFNNTNELKLLFAIIPPSIKELIFGNITTRFSNISDSSTNTTWNNTNIFGNPNSTLNSSTLLNGSASLDLNLLYDATIEWPILTYFARLAGYFLSRAHGLAELFRDFPVFQNIWKIILRGLLKGAGKTEILIENIRDLFGFNGTFSGNLFNFTYWEQIFSPSSIEHAIEGDLQTFTNLTNIFG